MSLNVLTVGAGRPLLALHGFTGTARSWSGQLDAWSADHQVIAPDLLGHGGSEAPSAPQRYALEDQARELAGLLELLGAVPAAVVGYSMGARLALVLTLRHRDLVERLILESPSAGIADDAERAERRRRDEALAADLDEHGLEAFVDRWEALPIFAGAAALPGAVRAEIRVQRLSHDPVGLAASLRGAGQGAMTPLHDQLDRVTVPTLVVAGALDAPGLARATAIAEAIPGARLEVVDGTGHTPHVEAPATFADLTLEFLSTSPSTPMHAR